MEQDDLIEMWPLAWPDKGTFNRVSAQNIKDFAKLVEERTAAKEREACAKVCIEHGKVWGERMLLGFQATLDDAAEAIRARGTEA